MSDDPSSQLLPQEVTRKPSSTRSKRSARAKMKEPSRRTEETSPLLANSPEIQNYGDAPDNDDNDDDSVAALSLGSANNDKSKNRRYLRWPSILALVFLTAVVLAILGLGFAAPAVVEEYAKEALVFEPTGLSIDSFTSNGLRARVQGDFTLDGSRVQKKSVRDLGRAGTFIARAVESKEFRATVYLPERGNLLLGTAVVPPIVVSIRDGETTHIDFICELSAGDLDGLRDMVNDWIQGRLDRLSIRGVANVPLKSGIIGLGIQTVSETLVFDGEKLPQIPAYQITKLNFHEVNIPQRAMAVDVVVSVSNDYPVSFTVPPLEFDILVPACSSDMPFIRLANATTDQLLVEPRKDLEVGVQGLVQHLPDTIKTSCPKLQKSPLDLLVGGYMRGDETTLYIRGSSRPNQDAPEWVSQFIQDITVPVAFTGNSFESLIRNFTLADVHFGLPNPFSGPESPDSKPKISATVRAIVRLPAEMNFPISVSRVRARADISYKGRKLGELDLHQWQRAESHLLAARKNESTGLSVSSVIKDAPLDITDDDVFSDVVEAMLFGESKVVLGVTAAVDVETSTTLGLLVVRDIPAEGKVSVKPFTSGDTTLNKLVPKVGDLRIMSTSRDEIILRALVNISNPTNYSATVPYADLKLLSNGTAIGHARVKNISLTPGENDKIPVEAFWNPSSLGDDTILQGREFLSQYISGYNLTLTIQTHRDTIPTQPALGLALARFTIDVPAPALHTPDNPNHSEPEKDRDPSAPKFIDDATFHVFTSSATFTLLSPLPYSTITITHLNATAYYNHTNPVGIILYNKPFEVPPGVSQSPSLPVQWSIGGVGYRAILDAVGGRLKLDAKAELGIQIGQWRQDLWFIGHGVGAGISV